MTAEGESKKTSRDAEESEDDLSSSELDTAVLSAMGEALTSLELTGTDSEVGTETTEKGTLDPELMKPHPPNEDCPVCFVPLPFGGHTYFDCCGKLICSACTSEHIRANHIINTKREKKELPELENTCPFCREPQRQKSNTEIIDQLEERTLKGDEVAACDLAKQYVEGGVGLEQDEGKAVEIFHRAADMGSARANFWLSSVYAFKEDLVEVDFNKAKMYAERAVKLNDPYARSLLALLAVQGKHKQLHIAIQHYKLGAAAGCKELMDQLWKFFYKGKISKDDLEDTLRKNHAACKNMSSEERERYNAWRAARENDPVLRSIYNRYYRGEVNAKQLKMMVKMWQNNGVLLEPFKK